jgi:hypothetical protein
VVRVHNTHTSTFHPLVTTILDAQHKFKDAFVGRFPAATKEKVGTRDAFYLHGRLLVPAEASDVIKTLCSIFHDRLHDSAQAARDRLRAAGIFVEGIGATMDHYVATCVCQLARTPTEPRQVGEMILPARYPPGAAIMADYAPLEKTSDGYVAVFVVLDTATRYATLSPVKEMTAAASTHALNEWRCLFGTPLMLLTDGGSHFKGEVLDWCAYHSIAVNTSTAHHHESVGAAEKLVQRVKRALRALLPPDKHGGGADTSAPGYRDWVPLLPDLQAAINDAPLKARCGFSPRRLFLAGAAQSADNFLRGLPAEDAEQNLLHLIEATMAFREWAELGLGVHGLHSKVKHDKALVPYNPNTGATAPEVGEWVLVHNPKGGHGVNHYYMGPFIVTALEAVDGRPTGFLTVAEVLSGIHPGEPGYPARGKPVEVHVDRLWPFNPERLTADFLMRRKLPEGWYTVHGIVKGPNAKGMFLVDWMHGVRTWEFPSVLCDTRAFQLYCSEMGLTPQGRWPRGKKPAKA